MKTKNVELQQELVFKNGKAYAFTLALNNYQEIDDCEYFKEKVAEQDELKAKKVELEKQIAEIDKELQLNKKEQLELEGNGYCPIDQLAYERVGGVVVNEYKTHRTDCRHKGA